MNGDIAQRYLEKNKSCLLHNAGPFTYIPVQYLAKWPFLLHLKHITAVKQQRKNIKEIFNDPNIKWVDVDQQFIIPTQDSLLQKIRGTNFGHKIFQSGKNTR